MGTLAHWIRCRLVDPDARQTTYAASPTITHLEVHAAGGVVTASHGSTKPQELLGISDGTPGQVFRTSQCPVLARRAHERIVVSAYGESSEWSEVEDFSRSGPDDPHYTFDSSSGVVRFGPSVAQADGRSRQFGAVVPVGADVTMTSYRVGGGRIGNVGAFTLTNLLSTVPHIVRVQNHARPRRAGSTPRPGTSGATAPGSGCRPGSAPSLATTTSASRWRRTRTSLERSARRRRAPTTSRSASSRRTWSEVPVLDDLAPTDDVRRAVCDAIELRRTVGTSVTVGAPHYLGVARRRTSAVEGARPPAAGSAVRRRARDVPAPVDGRRGRFRLAVRSGCRRLRTGSGARRVARRRRRRGPPVVRGECARRATPKATRPTG